MNNNFDPFKNFNNEPFNNEPFNNFENENSITDLSSDSDDDTLDTLIKTNSDNDVNLLNKLTTYYNKYEKKLENINIKKKKITAKLENIKQTIMPLMEKNEVDFININSNNGGGKFKYNTTKAYKSVSKKYLHNILQVYFKNEHMVKELCQFIYSNREFKNKVYLTKTKK
jgi:hypothetical protein